MLEKKSLASVCQNCKFPYVTTQSEDKVKLTPSRFKVVE